MNKQLNKFKNNWYWYTGLLLGIMTFQTESKGMGILAIILISLNIIGITFAKDLKSEEGVQK